MIAFATVEDALSALHEEATMCPYDERSCHLASQDYYDAARDRVSSELTRLRAVAEKAIRLLNMLDRIECRHPDVAEFLDGLAAPGKEP